MGVGVAISVVNSGCAVDFFMLNLIPTKTEANKTSPGR